MDVRSKKRRGVALASRVLNVTEVCEALGISRATLRRWELGGHFPARRQIGPARVGWLQSDYEKWLANRPPARGGVEPTGGAA